METERSEIELRRDKDAMVHHKRGKLPFFCFAFPLYSDGGLLAVIIYDVAMAVTNLVYKHCKTVDLDKNGTSSLTFVRR